MENKTQKRKTIFPRNIEELAIALTEESPSQVGRVIVPDFPLIQIDDHRNRLFEEKTFYFPPKQLQMTIDSQRVDQTCSNEWRYCNVQWLNVSEIFSEEVKVFENFKKHLFYAPRDHQLFNLLARRYKDLTTGPYVQSLAKNGTFDMLGAKFYQADSDGFKQLLQTELDRRKEEVKTYQGLINAVK
jgi:hypothetical protein